MTRRLLARLRASLADETGSIAAWVIITAGVFALLIGLAVDVSGQVRARQHAYMVAGEAARAGTGQVSADSAMGGDTIAVDPAAAADAASAYLAASDVTGTVTITGGGTILEVVTSDTYDPRFLGTFGVGPLTVGGHAQARLVRVMDGSEQ